jgi:hypothetical protein
MGKDEYYLPAKAFFLFHLHVGIRIALRIFIPAVGLFFSLYYVLGPEFFLSLLAALLDGGFLLSGIFTILVFSIIAGFAARRVCLGLNGWIRHLPASSLMHRRMTSIALFTAQIPILIILAVLVYISSNLFEVTAEPYLIGLPFVGLASSIGILHVKRKIISRPLAASSGILLSSNDWGLLIAGIFMLLAADAVSGPLVHKLKRSNFHKPSKGRLLVAFINWRAMRLRLLIPYLLSLPVLGASQIFIINNNPSPLLAEQVIRFGGASGMMLFCSVFAGVLSARRPPWPWIRSLPWPARSRILADFSFIYLHTIPFLIMVGVMNLKSMIPIAASSPLFVLYSVYSIRQSPDSPMGPSGKVLLLGAVAALILCLMPWSSLFFLGLAPWIFRKTTQAEKKHKVSKWIELHHLAAGDSLSWSE